MHFHPYRAVTLAFFTDSAGHIETKAPRFVATRSRVLRGREELAYRREQAGVGGRVRARRAANR